MLPLCFVSYFWRGQGSFLANVTLREGLEMFSTTFSSHKKPGTFSRKRVGLGERTMEVEAICLFNFSLISNGSKPPPFLDPSHCKLSRLVGSISSRIISFLCGHRKFSTHSKPGGLVVARGVQEA